MAEKRDMIRQDAQAELVGVEILCKNSIELIQYARRLVVKQVNLVQLMTYYTIGRWIVEEQQCGVKRAQYGAQVIRRLSEALSEKFGRGFSKANLEFARKFYLTYQDRIAETVFRQFAVEKTETLFRQFGADVPFSVSWSHYLILMRISNADERNFYEIEARKNSWSVKELGRQYGSSLYERLFLSTNKEKVMQMSKKGQSYETPTDVIKDPYVLEFLGLQERPEYTESELESRIINHLQAFLMEMGKGFTFVGRQVRFTFDEEHFRVDLVLYHRLLRCFVLIDLKIGKLTHQDLGQMQMYVNYYDRYEKTADEKPTIGILLCNEKNDAVVKMTLPENSNIYASEYQLYLPDKKELQKKLREWIAEETGGEGHGTIPF